MSPLLGGNVLSPPTPNPVVAVVPVCVLCETDYRKKINNENDHSDTIKQDMCVYVLVWRKRYHYDCFVVTNNHYFLMPETQPKKSCFTSVTFCNLYAIKASNCNIHKLNTSAGLL